MIRLRIKNLAKGRTEVTVALIEVHDLQQWIQKQKADTAVAVAPAAAALHKAQRTKNIVQQELRMIQENQQNLGRVLIVSNNLTAFAP